MYYYPLIFVVTFLVATIIDYFFQLQLSVPVRLMASIIFGLAFSVAWAFYQEYLRYNQINQELKAKVAQLQEKERAERKLRQIRERAPVPEGWPQPILEGSKLALESLSLLQQNGQIWKIDRLVNKSIIKVIRPIAIIQAPRGFLYLQKVLTVRFEIIDPIDRIVYQSEVQKVIQLGKNHFISQKGLSTYHLARGAYQLRIYLSQEPWAHVGFSVSNQSIDQIGDAIAKEDGEAIAASDRIVEQLGGQTIDDLLKGGEK